MQSLSHILEESPKFSTAPVPQVTSSFKLQAKIRQTDQ